MAEHDEFLAFEWVLASLLHTLHVPNMINYRTNSIILQNFLLQKSYLKLDAHSYDKK